MAPRKLTAEEHRLILKIAERVRATYPAPLDKLELAMDITACHLGGCPLRLSELLEAADDFNLMHDVLGIRRHLDRSTGELKDCFLPRYAMREDL